MVVGLPRSLNGGEGPAAAKVAVTQELARGIAPVGVRLVDERMTTVTAQPRACGPPGVKAKKGRSVIDQAAAVMILQNALEAERVSEGTGRRRRSGYLIAIR